MDLGRYLLHEEIAKGGMASVHVGRLRGAVGFARTVAIKRLHPPFARDPDFVSMLVDEARLASRVRHLNVVPILDVVCLEDEVFVVMEHVLGDSVARILRGGTAPAPLPPEVAVAIALGVLHGLHAAHEATSERGTPLAIVHRDVSPQNVLVGVDGVARIADFGVAKAALRVQSTRDGHIKGKLAYMAPEQIAGQDVDRRTDVYATGVVLWEMLTGERLFEHGRDASPIDLDARATLAPPSARHAGVPTALDAVVKRALSFHPDGRFATARDMAVALEHAVVPATQRSVAQWLEATAPASVARSRALVAAVEGGAPSAKEDAEPAGPPAMVTASVAMGPPDVAAPRVAPLAPEERVELAEPVAPVERPSAAPAERARAHARRHLALAARIVLAAAATVFLAVHFGGRDDAEAAEMAVAEVTPVARTVEERDTPRPIVPALTPLAEPAPPTRAAPHRAAGPRASGRGRPASAAAAVPTPTPGATCSPPYTVDTDGVRHPKRHCL